MRGAVVKLELVDGYHHTNGGCNMRPYRCFVLSVVSYRMSIENTIN